jgi:hypothetical protein
MTHELGRSRTFDELALAGVGVYAKLLVHLSSVLGETATRLEALGPQIPRR